jgi:hypothetical protein
MPVTEPVSLLGSWSVLYLLRPDLTRFLVPTLAWGYGNRVSDR